MLSLCKGARFNVGHLEIVPGAWTGELASVIYSQKALGEKMHTWYWEKSWQYLCGGWGFAQWADCLLPQCPGFHSMHGINRDVTRAYCLSTGKQRQENRRPSSSLTTEWVPSHPGYVKPYFQNKQILEKRTDWYMFWNKTKRFDEVLFWELFLVFF